MPFCLSLGDFTGRAEWAEWAEADDPERKKEPKLVCANMNIQMRRHQHVYMGKSDVAGVCVCVCVSVRESV